MCWGETQAQPSVLDAHPVMRAEKNIEMLIARECQDGTKQAVFTLTASVHALFTLQWKQPHTWTSTRHMMLRGRGDREKKAPRHWPTSIVLSRSSTLVVAYHSNDFLFALGSMCLVLSLLSSSSIWRKILCVLLNKIVKLRIS